jgi:hypothetical protein
MTSSILNQKKSKSHMTQQKLTPKADDITLEELFALSIVDLILLLIELFKSADNGLTNATRNFMSIVVISSIFGGLFRVEKTRENLSYKNLLMLNHT